MKEKTNEELIKEQVESLPKAVKAAIASFDWARIVFEIGRKNNLHVDDIGEIQKEVMLVVLGLISPKEFYDQMVERVGIEEDRAFEIADAVNEKVFVRIREFMKEYYAEEEKNQGERKILNSAGIRFDDGEDLPEVPPKNSVIEEKPLEDEEVLIPPPAEEIKDSEEKIQEKKINEIKNLPDTPKNYLDPYREPVE